MIDTSKITVRDITIPEDEFLKKHEKVLTLWPTGKEVDLEEAIAYNKSLPDDKNMNKMLKKYKAAGKTSLYPRSGTPVLEEEIKLLRSLNEVGVFMFPFTTDSYNRNLKFDMAQKGLEESIKTGKAKLNGFPIVNHGVKNTRKVIESCKGAFDIRSSREGQFIIAEIAFASGVSAIPQSMFGWLSGFDKRATPEECIQTCQLTARLSGCYAERGHIINHACHGWLPNGIIPTYVSIACMLLEALVSAGQGAKSFSPMVNFNGNMAQDLGEFRATEKLFRKYLDKYGHADCEIPGLIGNQSFLYPFPSDVGMAYGYINYTAMLGALARLPACSVKTIDEALGIPSIEAHQQTYRSANWIYNIVRQQEMELNSKDIDIEERMTELSVGAIIERVMELGGGDVAVGIVKALDEGVLDSPFSISMHLQDNTLGVRDLHGAMRYLEYGNVPIPEEVREFSRQKIREREEYEGRKMSYKVSIADMWTICNGTLIDPKESIVYEEETPNPYLEAVKKAKPNVVTGTVGVDAHVIGTKLISRSLRENGFTVAALGAQTLPEEFIKAAQETAADAMMITSLYGMAEQDLQGFREKCDEAGLDGILLLLGGNLGVGKHDFKEDEEKFSKMGFDRVYPPDSSIEKSIQDLCADLRAKGRI
ncbi:MAG: methylaspartate mutase subunit S [Synergistaceae bacterium]|jgi:methylaspartate mutase epsilon subunit|nr:methylaspartate mutase subunit S [Synergistaceae bacterium]